MSQITSKPARTGLEDTFIKQIEDVLQQQREKTPFLHKVRKEALDSFAQLGLPAKKNEEYKYTHITRALEKEFGTGDAFSQTESRQAYAEQEISRLLPAQEEANCLVFINGQYAAAHSRIVSPAEQLVIQPLSEAFRDHPDLLEQYYGQHADSKTDAFTALNTALATEGVFLQVPKGKVVEAPVLLYFISDTTQGHLVSQLRNLYLIGEHSQLSLSESFLTVGDHPAYQNIVSEIVVERDAILNYHKIETEGSKSYHTGTTHIVQTAQSLCNAVTIALSGAMVRNNLNLILDAEHCEAHMYGLYMLDGETHVDNHTMADHRQPNSFSNELYKGIMDDQSHGVFNGKIYVRPGAQKTNAFQSNMNILLTDDASIDTKPQLEIWADDVKCSHGATTGQINDEQLFYLRTRGLNEKQARAILLKAFADDVLQNIKIDFIREQLAQIIAARLERNYHI